MLLGISFRTGKENDTCWWGLATSPHTGEYFVNWFLKIDLEWMLAFFGMVRVITGCWLDQPVSPECLFVGAPHKYVVSFWRHLEDSYWFWDDRFPLCMQAHRNQIQHEELKAFIWKALNGNLFDHFKILHCKTPLKSYHSCLDGVHRLGWKHTISERK